MLSSKYKVIKDGKAELGMCHDIYPEQKFDGYFKLLEFFRKEAMLDKVNKAILQNKVF
jgi:hypothetical protein